MCKDCFHPLSPLSYFGLGLPHRLFPCDNHLCLRCTPFVIRVDLLYSLLTSGLPHHVHVAHYGRPTVTIRPRPSPYQPGSRDQEIAQTLAESLNIRDVMSHTLTMPVPVGTINPITGHINEDDAALFQAIGPDQADPPSTQGQRSEPPRIPFGWVRPPMGGPPGGFPGGGGPPGGGFPGGGGPPRGGFPGGRGPPVPLPPAPVVPGG
jgi:hypothetical protein